MNQNPLEFRNYFTDAEFKLHLYKLTIKELYDTADKFETLGMFDKSAITLGVLNEKINSIVTRID
jgi:hypothetical protein